MALQQLARSVANAGLKWKVAFGPAAQLPGCIASTSRGFAKVKEGLFYAKSHEWVEVHGDTATIGISDFAQEELGEVVYVELPSKDDEFKAGEPYGVVESVKAASDMYAPVSCTVIAHNEGLMQVSGEVNSDPFGKGWMLKVKLTNKDELSNLMDAKAYKASLPADKQE